MDPAACLERLRVAIENSYTDDVVPAAQDMLQWIRRGGACDFTITSRQLDRLMMVIIAYYPSRASTPHSLDVLA